MPAFFQFTQIELIFTQDAKYATPRCIAPEGPSGHLGSIASAAEKSGLVLRFDAKRDAGIIQKWPDFDTWLSSEIPKRTEIKKRTATFH